MQNDNLRLLRADQYVESLPTPSERLYAAAFAEYLAGRGSNPDLPENVRESRAAAIRATLKQVLGSRSSTVH